MKSHSFQGSRACAGVGFLLVGLTLATALPCRGVTLDWSLVTWPQGSLTNSFDIDATNPGNDVRITITGDTQYLTGNNPQIDSQVTGGLGKNTLSLDLTSTFDLVTETWTLTVEFLYASGVENVSYTIFDIDSVTSPPPADQLTKIYGIAAGSTNLVAPTIVGSSDNVVTGSGVNQSVTGILPNPQADPNGNVYISYSNTSISSFTYTMGMDTTNGNPQQLRSMHSALYNIVYSKPVPEVGVFLGPGVIAVFAAAFLCTHRFRARPTASH